MKKQVEDALKKINSDDLKMMFGTSIVSIISTHPMETIEEKLQAYDTYVVPVSIGDVIDIQGENYTVTCVYTDNSVDLLDKDAEKKNVGLYNINITIVDKLDCFMV